jgi:hypothetical protein
LDERGAIDLLRGQAIVGAAENTQKLLVVAAMDSKGPQVFDL